MGGIVASCRNLLETNGYEGEGVVALAFRGLPEICEGEGKGYSRLEGLWGSVVPMRLRVSGRVSLPGFFVLQRRVVVDYRGPVGRGAWGAFFLFVLEKKWVYKQVHVSGRVSNSRGGRSLWDVSRCLDCVVSIVIRSKVAALSYRAPCCSTRTFVPVGERTIPHLRRGE
jgi:hypothetical protein